uniref:Uncharacterized protein n=1 Tax=Plectus sambesii TaxID=2011161 RepID=A0A914WHL9_9BILA
MDVINPNTSSEYPRADLLKKVRAKWNESHSASKYFPVSQAILMFDAVLMAADGYKNLSSRRELSAKDTAKCRKVANDYKPLSYGTQLFEAMRDSMAKGMSGDLQMTPLGNRKNFTFNIDLLGYEGVLDNIGYWEPHSDVLVNLTKDSKAQLKYIEEGNNVKVSDELKPHFRVTTIIERPYVMYRRNHYDFHGNQKFEGFCIDLLTELSRDLGFTFTIHEVKDKKYGNDISGNGTWDGMVGEILRGEADMAVAPLTVNFKRAEVVDFTKPFLSLGISILFKIPDDQQPDLFSFLNPLSLETWFWVLIAAAFITFGMYCVARLTPYEWNLNFSCCTAHQPQPASDFVFVDNVPVADQPAIDDHPPQIELSNNYSFWNTMWYVTSTMLKGGCDFGPRAVSTRLLGGTWWVFTLVITSAYTANLAAVLTVSRTYVPIKNLDDLANQTQIAYGTINGGSTMQFFQESKISIHSKMWQYMATRQVFVKNNEQGVARVLSDNYAYLMESTSLEYEVQQNCNLTHVGGVLGSKGYGIALEKRSEWTDRISRQILLYAKRGIIELVKTKWWRSKGGSCSGPGSSVKQQRLSLNMQNVSGLFVILFVGLILAVLSVIVEFCIRSGQNAKADKKSFHAEVVQELRFALKLNDARHHRVIGKTATFFQIEKLNAEAPTAERPAQGARSNQSPARAQSKGSPTTSTTAFKRTLTPQIEVETFC